MTDAPPPDPMQPDPRPDGPSAAGSDASVDPVTGRSDTGPSGASGEPDDAADLRPAWPDPAPVSGWGSEHGAYPSLDGRAETPADRYSPAPSPPPQWQRAAWGESAPTTPVSWFEPAPAPVPTTPASGTRSGSVAGTGIGLILSASLVAAVLASGGTYLALNASGALDRPTPDVASGVATGAVEATSGPAPATLASPIVAVARRVSPAVVTIVNEASAQSTDPNNPLQIPETGVGSGIIFDPNGWILTNHHVVTGDQIKLTVKLSDGRRFDGRIYGIDTLTDLAIVKVEATGLPAAPIGDSSNVQVGQTAIAIGSPLGTYTNSVTSGIVSALGRSIQVDSGQINNLIQTDTAINPGNSGGPLLDADGKVIGINTAIASGGEGIGFAIPVNIARPIMQQALAGEALARPWIGVRYQAIDLELQQAEKLPVDKGAWVSGGQTTNGQSQPAIVPGSPADKAGLREGDIIVTVEGITIDGTHPLDAVLTQFAPGKTVTLEILRDGKKETLELTLGTRPANL